ncbi:hypothetical protein D8B26_001893 [Coccidioides posadasii str. Silveira]|uniref:Uncharacterized protein n=1 Tax=Coccidioides posadasii (strain RMSCC 757 / Silveira) TaxID=443226 RepID=E9CWT0_COCPS|nr:conserved hypothetical protein [Coccidioides posadasii str. Silveira]QVM07189.1 hypothetical protein D8B26_001893 [Coccidioides posadasii str. Silveira]
MPSKLSTPVLTVDPAKIHEVDTRSAESLHGMWMVFSRCADYMEEGRRLENLSWRLWNLETFCTSPPTRFQKRRIDRLRRESKDIPELSTSVDSAASDEAERIESQIKSPPKDMDIKPRILGVDPMLSMSRGRERHITSIGLEKMVYKIKEKKSLEPIAALPTSSPQEQQSQQQSLDITPRAASPTPTPKVRNAWESVKPHHSTDSCSTVALEANDSEASRTPASDTSVSSAGIVNSSSVVRGFSPSHISSSYRSKTQLNTGLVAPKPMTAIKPSPLKKKGMFTLGGSSGDDESSFEDRMAIKPQRSSLTDGLHKSTLSQQMQTDLKAAPPSDAAKSTKESTDDEAAIETDDEDIPESAIDDDSDWEDSVTESGRSSLDEKELFQRVDSRPNLVSRPSLLTMMMHQPQQTLVSGKGRNHNSRSTPALQRSRLASPNHQSSDEDDDENTLTMRGPEVPRSKPIVVKSVPMHSIAHSPRTTRRNMLATELTESLRRHLLWERQQKTAPAAAAFKRRHTAHDMANLQEYPGPKPSTEEQQQPQRQPPQAVHSSVQQVKDKETSKNNSWNHYFDYGPWEYHVKGW